MGSHKSDSTALCCLGKVALILANLILDGCERQPYHPREVNAHSKLGYLTPIEYENQLTEGKQAALRPLSAVCRIWGRTLPLLSKTYAGKITATDGLRSTHKNYNKT